MYLALSGIVIGLLMLVAGAHFLVEGGAGIARKLKISGHIIGLTLVAAATSLPELATSVTASVEGYPGLAVGNVVGSNAFNIGIVLGISVIITTTRSTRFSVRDGWVVLLSTALFGFFSMGTIGRVESGILLGAYILYLAYLFKISGSRSKIEENELVSGSNLKLLIMTLAGAGLLFVGSPILVRSSVSMAGSLGVRNSFVGLTLIAAGTSLPELLTSIVAAIKHQKGIAVGNVFGSNIFNILLIVGISGLINPIEMSGLMNPGVIPGMILITVIGILVSRKKMKDFHGVILILAYMLFFILTLPFAW